MKPRKYITRNGISTLAEMLNYDLIDYSETLTRIIAQDRERGIYGSTSATKVLASVNREVRKRKRKGVL